MSYYQGDFYRGDFYQGDPGFFSFLSGLASKGAKLAGFASPALPGAGILARGGGALAKFGAKHPALSGAIMRGGALIRKHPVLSAAGAAGTLGALGGGAGVMGARRGQMGAAGAMPGMRRRRRMRVTNPKALRRAIRRAEGFSKLARRVLRFTHPRLARGRPTFKIRRKKRIV